MVVLYVALYLAAIVAANLIVAWQGAWVSPYTGALFIGLDLTVKDHLQDRWSKRGLVWRMGLLILAGSGLSWFLNRNAGRIAVASFVAFAVSSSIDALVYALVPRPRLEKVGWSNLFGSISDSIVFPALAFGWPPSYDLVLAQMAFKLAGGQFWSLVLAWATNRRGTRANT
jgi:uncharacterized PurR-regulated membrane protein YhhQ (DUF165 family)